MWTDCRALRVLSAHMQNRNLSIFFLLFTFSFNWERGIRDCSIDAGESSWTHRTGLSESHHARRLGEVCKFMTFRVECFHWSLNFIHNRDNGWAEEDVLKIIISLQQRGLIKSMEFNSFTRIHHEDKEIKVVKQMPTIASNKQPTIAVITAQYCEKIAVDAMLENKETFVRYTTVGKLLDDWRFPSESLSLSAWNLSARIIFLFNLF